MDIIKNNLHLSSKKTEKILKVLIFFQIILIMFQDFFIYTLGIPSIIAYINDFFTLSMLFLGLKSVISMIKTICLKPILISLFLFFNFCIFGIIVNKVPLILSIYGFRQTFRFYVLFLVSIAVLKKSDIVKICEFLLKFQIINVILIAYEYFILQVRGDYLGGIFGTELSCNVPLNLYLCVITTYVIAKYLSNEGSLFELIWICLSSLGIAGLSELKFYFIEFLFILIVLVLLTKPNKKTLLIIVLITFFSIVFGLLLLKIIFPLQFEILTNPLYLFNYLSKTDYSGAYTVSRTNFYSQINELFFNDNMFLKLIGYGLGNCETSSLSLLNSDFYQMYGYSFNYNWFSSSMKYLETGIIGMILYLSFYVVVIKDSFKIRKTIKNKDKLIVFNIVVVFICLINIFYNNTAYKYINYLNFVFLAIPYIYMKENKENNSLFYKASQMKKEIPKIIHFCWFGPNDLDELSTKCIASWKKLMPDYEIKMWNESNFDVNINQYVKEAYQAKKYAFVSDYVRLYVVYHYGGIYLDTDIEMIKDFSDILSNGGFFGLEKSGHINTGLGFASEKNNPVIGLLLNDYDKISFINGDKIDNTPCPIRNSKLLSEKYNFIQENKLQLLSNILVYPNDYFCPIDYDTGKTIITTNTHSIHHFNASWYSKQENAIHQIKRKLIKIFGKNIGTIIFKILVKLHFSNVE